MRPRKSGALGVDLEDLRARLQVRQAELDLAVEAAGPQQRRVERIGPIRRHQHLHAGKRASELAEAAAGLSRACRARQHLQVAR
jgi:hypothetical protein